MRRADPVDRLLACSTEERARILRGMTSPQRRELNGRWARWAHPGQLAPDGDWRVWMIVAGRGFGKTRAGAEWISAFARANPAARIALVGNSVDDVRRVMIEGESGLLAVAQAEEKIAWHASRGEVTFEGGASAFVYSAAAPERLRGPEHHAAWCDEVAKWGPGSDVAWDNLTMSLRLGAAPRIVVTTTPRPVPLMRRIARLPDVVLTRGRTIDNPHLPDSFVEAMVAQYGGTRIGRQELDGELIEDVAGALWTRALIEAARVRERPPVRRVVVGVDPPAGSQGDACGIVAVALGRDGLAYVIEDASVAATSPEGWARAAAACAVRTGADRVVAEANNGGDMVRSVLMAADTDLPLKLVHASRGKSARAEPVAALYEAGRAFHVGAFPALEDELCGLIAGGGYAGPGRSPDRADALVWAMSEVMLKRRGVVGVRVM